MEARGRSCGRVHFCGRQVLRLKSKSDTLLTNLRIPAAVLFCRLYILGTLIDFLKLGAVVTVLLLSTQVSRAQSNDQTLPTAVLTNEISGTIPALDVGDSRLTRHYYAFEATPGDLSVTVNSRNLNGDLDIFTAVTFRPLLKISIYANTIPPEVTKGVYFRTRQIVILRVEARSPDDDPGSYKITFGGSFQPFSGGIPVAENTESSSDTATTSRNPRRLSSVGATITQPPEPKAEEARTEAKPSDTEPPKETEPKPAPKPKPTRTTTRGSARNRTPRTTRTKPPETVKPTSESTKTDTSEAEPPKAEKPKTAKSRTTKPKVEPKPPAGEEKSGETQPTTPQEPPGPHLIIEQTDGTRIDRPMSTVRRVIVEGGTIVVVLKTGKIERVPMSVVLRMSIEP